MVTRMCSKSWITSLRLETDHRVLFSKQRRLVTMITEKRQEPEDCKYRSTLCRLMMGRRVSRADPALMELLLRPTRSGTIKMDRIAPPQMRTWNSSRLHLRASQSIQLGSQDRGHDLIYPKAQASWATPNTSLVTRSCLQATASLSSRAC